MNHVERRAMRLRSASRLKKSKSYILITFDGEKRPVFSFDMTGCDNQKDLRHVFMRNLAEVVSNNSMQLSEAIEKNVAEIEAKAKVEKYKEERSAELAKEGLDPDLFARLSAVPSLGVFNDR
jgi:hypothetical protein